MTLRLPSESEFNLSRFSVLLVDWEKRIQLSQRSYIRDQECNKISN